MSVVCIVVESMSIHVMMNWHIKLRVSVKEKAIAYLRDREDKAETTDPVPGSTRSTGSVPRGYLTATQHNIALPHSAYLSTRLLCVFTCRVYVLMINVFASMLFENGLECLLVAAPKGQSERCTCDTHVF